MKKILSLVLGLLWTLPSWGALPDGYTELQYIESTGTQYIDTGYTPTTAGYSANVKFMLTGDTLNNQTIIGFNTVLSDVRERMSFGLNGTARVVFGYGNGSTEYSNDGSGVIQLNRLTEINVNFVTSASLRINGTEYFSTSTFTRANSTSVYLMKVNGSEQSSTGRWYSAQIYNQNNELVRNFVPAKNASGVVGMYDTVNNRFYTNAGTGEFIAGDPVPDNSCRNLFDKDAEYINAYVNANSGVLTIGNSGSTTQYSFVIPVQPNTKYTLSGMSSGSSWGSFEDNSIGATATSKLAGNGTLTTGANDKYLIGLAYASGTQYDYRQTLQIEEGDVATEYVPYCKKIKIATTKYNETKFSPLNTALANAISVVDTVVSNTITQAGRIATLQAQKQTRPDETCPAGKKCLLVEDASGIPHWYEIVERYSLLPDGYTELQYVNMETGSYLKTNVIPVYNGRYEFDFQTTILPSQSTFYLGVRDATGGVEGLSIVRRATSSGGTISFDGFQEDMRYNTSYAIVADTRYKYTYDNSVVNFVQGNTLIASHTFTPDSTITSALVINAFNTKGSVQPSTAAIYVYSFKAWNAQGIQIANLVPAKDAGGVVGMYDTVSGTFFTNAGTGEFVAGPVSE